MSSIDLFTLTFIFGLIAMFVPLLRKLGINTYVCFILVGVLGGEYGLAIIHQKEDLRFIAEFGIVILFFVIGLEFNFAQLWALRSDIFRLGLSQTIITSLIFWLIIHISLDTPLAVSFVLGFALSTSSTALSLSTIEENAKIASQVGRAVFSLTLFHNLLIILLIALSQYLSSNPDDFGLNDQVVRDVTQGGLSSLITVFALSILVLMLLLGRQVFKRVLIHAASTNKGVLLAAILFSVALIGQYVHHLGAPMELGALIMGILLSDSGFRFQIEETLRPIKELLIGLLFLTLGMSFDILILAEHFILILVITSLLVSIKFFVTFLILRHHKYTISQAKEISILQACTGELALLIIFLTSMSQLINSELEYIGASIIVFSIILSAAIQLPILSRYLKLAPTPENNTRKLKVFISYSRQNRTSAELLLNKLEQEGFDVLIDTRDLPYGEKWQAELEYYIQQADTVIWLVSKHSICSQWCQWELSKVEQYSKRLIPLVLEEQTELTLPQTIKKIQLFPSIGQLDLNDSIQLDSIKSILLRDNDWLKEQTRLAERARKWALSNRKDDWLLRGEELKNALTWQSNLPEQITSPDSNTLDLIHSSQAFVNKAES